MVLVVLKKARITQIEPRRGGWVVRYFAFIPDRLTQSDEIHDFSAPQRLRGEMRSLHLRQLDFSPCLRGGSRVLPTCESPQSTRSCRRRGTDSQDCTRRTWASGQRTRLVRDR